MIRTAKIFRHSLDNGPVTIEAVLRERNVATEIVDSFAEDLEGFDPLEPDLLVVMGGACGVYQDGLYPFLKTEQDILRRRLKADRPTLGICLGAQLMAAALGARVYKAEQPEIGWFPIDLTEAGENSPLRALGRAHTLVMQWHGDTFDLPEGAVLLASSEIFPHQAFQYGRNALALLPHIEVTAYAIKGWCVGAAADVAEGRVDLPGLRKDTAEWAEKMERQARTFLHDWLDGAGRV